jgi:hypothetical protein
MQLVRALKTRAKGLIGEVKASGRMWTEVGQQRKPREHWYEWCLKEGAIV